MIFSAGTPYNITTGSDLNSDGQYNDRPMFGQPNGIAAGTPGTNTIAGCGSFVAPPPNTPYTPIPINYCTGPTQFTMNLRVTKTFGFGPSTGQRPRGQVRAVRGGPGAPAGRWRPWWSWWWWRRWWTWRWRRRLRRRHQHRQTVQPGLWRSGTEPLQQRRSINAEWCSDIAAVWQIDAACRKTLYQQLRCAADFAADVVQLLANRLIKAEGRDRSIGCALSFESSHVSDQVAGLKFFFSVCQQV